MIEIKRRVMIIPKIEKYIGSVGDSNAEYRTFRINRYTDTQIDIADLAFYLVIENENGTKKEVFLDSEVGKNYIDLTWRIVADDIRVSGTILAQVKGFDTSGLVRWHSFSGAFYVMDNLGEVQDGMDLTDYERILAKIDQYKQDAMDAQIESTEVDAEGYLHIYFADGREDSFYVKGDPASQEEIQEAVRELGIDIENLINQASDAAAFAIEAADTARMAAERAEQAARGEKVSATITLNAIGWTNTAPYTLEMSDETLGGKMTSDFVTKLVLPDEPTEDQVKELKKNYGCIDKIDITENGIVATCYSKRPTENISIYFREV